MPIVSAVFSYVQGTYGWTEKLFIERSSTNLQDYYPPALALVQKRIQLSGSQTQAQYVRLSREDVLFDSLLFAFGPDNIVGAGGKDSDNPTTCLLLQASDPTQAFRKNLFIRGIWDEIVLQGGRYQPTPAFLAVLNSYIGQLKLDGWGWMAANRPSTVGNLVNIVQEESGQVTVTTAADFFLDSQVGKSVEVRLAKIDSPKNLNGQIVLVPSSRTVASSLRKIAMLDYTFGGTARYSTFTLRVVDTARAQRIGEHRTGRPILQPRGRYRARIRG